MLSVLGSIGPWLDHVVGADRLSQAARGRLASERIRAIRRSTPAMIAAATAMSAVMLAAAADTDAFPQVALWFVVSSLLLGYGLLVWLRNRENEGPKPVASGRLARATLICMTAGVLWGTAPALILSAGDQGADIAVVVATAGILFASGSSLAALPMAAVAFAVPAALGLVAALVWFTGPAEASILTAVLLICMLALGAVGLRSARGFVKRVGLAVELRAQKEVISLLLKEFEDHGSDWLWTFDRNGAIRGASDRFAASSGFSKAELEGQDIVRFLRSITGERQPAVDEIAHSVAAHAPFSDLQIRVVREGEERWWRLTGKPVEDEFGAYAGYIGTTADVTAEKTAEKRINFLAHNDPLTGLLNRAKFTDQLKQCVARLERYGSPFSIMFLDLDQFKLVNDSRGHLIGDKLLTEVAKRIRSCIREADTAARLGGDEFAILMNNGCTADETAALAARLVRAVAEPYEFDDEAVSVGVSIGIAMAPVNGIRPDQLLRNADLALYRAKADGRGVYRFFESQMDSDVRERRILELELRDAMKDGQLMLFYQPLVSADDNAPTGFEALVRWNHPIRGVVPPAEFIPIAEQSGLIRQIGDWTIREACHAAARWPNDMIVAVNLSAKHFKLSDITLVVRRALAESGLAPHRLELEITESLLIERPEQVVEKLTEIKALGVTIAMDDFGTGYSSLSYLMKFPFDKIKIDKSFVTASSDDTVARDILRTIASLGRTLQIRITAEGVETQEQVEFLREIACNQLQGYYFAKPLNEMDLAGYFLRHFEQTLAPVRPATVIAAKSA